MAEGDWDDIDAVLLQHFDEGHLLGAHCCQILRKLEHVDTDPSRRKEGLVAVDYRDRLWRHQHFPLAKEWGEHRLIFDAVWVGQKQAGPQHYKSCVEVNTSVHVADEMHAELRENLLEPSGTACVPRVTDLVQNVPATPKHVGSIEAWLILGQETAVARRPAKHFIHQPWFLWTYRRCPSVQQPLDDALVSKSLEVAGAVRGRSLYNCSAHREEDIARAVGKIGPGGPRRSAERGRGCVIGPENGHPRILQLLMDDVQVFTGLIYHTWFKKTTRVRAAQFSLFVVHHSCLLPLP
mmetsp:Transcript_19164/g.44873  ORF Transcript_19164/g.44873 Transcript_19164/m.44873 type:complete len:294 (-) Transcript_19164:251-1132(-)